jgi:protein-S-isoprenylcysteine O-methyltransferase Ste14
MDIDLICKFALITIYSLFSLIRIEYYRRTKKAGYKTVIQEKLHYTVWLSIFICYEIITFFIYIFFPESLSWGSWSLPVWSRLAGAIIGFITLLWFIWIHQTLGNNLSARIGIKESQNLVTSGPYHWLRHPMYTAFFVIHIAVFLLTSNWFIGATWLAGLIIILVLRVKREEKMLIGRFGKEYISYMERTDRFIPLHKIFKSLRKE